jgi:Tfp pilus assembly pilus retraction ATPase PilT
MTPALEIMLNSPMVKKLIEENRLDKLSPPSKPARTTG